MLDAILWGAGLVIGAALEIFTLSVLSVIMAATFLHLEERKNGGKK